MLSLSDTEEMPIVDNVASYSAEFPDTPGYFPIQKRLKIRSSTSSV